MVKGKKQITKKDIKGKEGKEVESVEKAIATSLAKKISKNGKDKKEKEESESENHSESESENGDFVSDEDGDDELDADVDVDDDSVDGSDSESDDSDSADDIPKKKKRKTDDGSESFATAFNSIIGSKLKAYDREAPIMVRNKKVLKQLESDKLESQAKRAILAEKKQLYDKHRVKNLLPSGEEDVRKILEHEKKLKKTAQKGVVKLFNAVLSTQIKTTQALSKEKVGEMKKEELFNEMSKEQFLDMVQSAGNQ